MSTFDDQMETIQGTLADIPRTVERALSFEQGTFVAALPYQSDLFVQFTCHKGAARFDFPLFTEQQREYETA
ncbi:MAG TPA: hypothetical protein VF493_15860, partial [Terriglobales bacterium]